MEDLGTCGVWGTMTEERRHESRRGLHLGWFRLRNQLVKELS